MILRTDFGYTGEGRWGVRDFYKFYLHQDFYQLPGMVLVPV
jgi:hypothetical protein